METANLEQTKRMFRTLLAALWLRPESALWYAHMLSAASDFLGSGFAQPSLEFGSMDGVNTCILLGGELPFDFDVFQETRWDKDSHLRSSLLDDYYDVTRDDVALRLERKPRCRISVGVDWKDAHFVKAGRLDTFERFAWWKAEGGSIANVDDHSIETIWAPNIYWLPEVARVLAEFRRVLKPGGRIVTIGPDRELLNHVIYRFAGVAPEPWLRDLDRGRHENARQNARTHAEWQSLFSGGGFAISRHRQFIPSLVGDAYEVGFRPMFAPLLHMYEKIRASSPETLLALKRDWVASLETLGAPLCDETWMRKRGNPYLWHIFELRART